VQLEGSLISREHFALTNTEGRIKVRDLSSNGTWFKDERLARGSQIEIKDGDSIFVPGYRVEIRVSDQEPEPAPSPAPSETVEEPEPRWPWLKPVHDLLGRFSGLELFLSLAAICCFCFVLFYVLS
jgi:pSer/pThr/pTyr-binding forkhead associated (FHA) protein